MAVSEVFRGAPKVALAGQGTLLEALQAGIAYRLAMLEDPAATGAGQSAMGLLGVSAGGLAETLASHLVHEITVRGAQGGPLADQLNHDMTHLQGQRVEGMLAQVVSLVTARQVVIARVASGPGVTGSGEPAHPFSAVITCPIGSDVSSGLELVCPTLTPASPT